MGLSAREMVKAVSQTYATVRAEWKLEATISLASATQAKIEADPAGHPEETPLKQQEALRTRQFDTQGANLPGCLRHSECRQGTLRHRL